MILRSGFLRNASAFPEALCRMIGLARFRILLKLMDGSNKKGRHEPS
jgi:hypothetical protein